MSINLSNKSFLKMLDLSPDEIKYLVELGCKFKALKHASVPHKYLAGKNIALIFEKTSTRTRCSFEVAARDLGMGVTYLDPASSQIGKKESIADTGRVLGRIFDGIEYRGFSQSIVDELSSVSCVPVFNGLTDEAHPTQMIADMMTIKENFPNGFAGLKFVFMGDTRNNMGNSLMVCAAKLGMHFVACGPSELRPEEWLIKECESIARETGGSVTCSEDVSSSVSDANVVYTDIWVSMGEPDSVWGERIKLLSPYQVNSDIMGMCAENSIFMHCLPSFHDLGTDVAKEIHEKFGLSEMEVTNEVFESEKSKVFDEAENRMHSIKAILYAALG